MKITLNNYGKLLSQIQRTIKQTEKNIVATVNRQKVLMSWQIGKIIDEHLVKNDRAQYGEKLFKQLEQDTSIPRAILYQMRNFHKAYPTLPENENDLSWSHYRSLASVDGEEQRKYLEDLTVKNNLGAEALEKEVAKTKTSRKKYERKKLKVTRGKVFAYKLKTFTSSKKSFVDCGFDIFTEVNTSLKGEGLIVSSVKKGEKYSLKKSAVTVKELYIYKAYLERVVDGDTIHVILDLGFKIQHQVILRLAKIAAAEMDTEQGKKSAAALKKILKDVPFLILKTNKVDIYGRYVADVFFDEKKKETSPQKVADRGVYLNQLLLDRELVELY